MCCEVFLGGGEFKREAFDFGLEHNVLALERLVFALKPFQCRL